MDVCRLFFVMGIGSARRDCRQKSEVGASGQQNKELFILRRARAFKIGQKPDPLSIPHQSLALIHEADESIFTGSTASLGRVHMDPRVINLHRSDFWIPCAEFASQAIA